MSVWRCTSCDFNPPSHVAFARFRDANEHTGARRVPACPLCDEKMIYFSARTPDTDWEERLSDSTPPTAESGSPHPENDSATVVYRNDTDTVHVSHKELVGLGYEPQVDLVVRLNGKYYELEGRDAAFWWIAPFAFGHDLAMIAGLPQTEPGTARITGEDGEDLGYFHFE